MQEGGRVDLARKEELILAKQIRQNTTKILQRPSYFHGPEPKKMQDKSEFLKYILKYLLIN